ncbi:hypothetical protein SLS58_002942 [Diplodia intermedia]|uniref:Uncharacterized protein n=1 Tax=Diplodia intermedia TaxID=856260 RepID=A0ABR3TXK4_9PEZI
MPSNPNLRTKSDLLDVDQAPKQLQSTLYENPKQAAAAGIAQPDSESHQLQDEGAIKKGSSISKNPGSAASTPLPQLSTTDIPTLQANFETDDENPGTSTSEEKGLPYIQGSGKMFEAIHNAPSTSPGELSSDDSILRVRSLVQNPQQALSVEKLPEDNQEDFYGKEAEKSIRGRDDSGLLNLQAEIEEFTSTDTGPQSGSSDGKPTVDHGVFTPTLEDMTYGRIQERPVETWDGSTCSYGPASIFSTATGASATTAGTQYSEADLVSATHQLVHLLSQHEGLKPLIEEAVESNAIGADKFCNNFRRLLKIYSKDLDDDAGESLEFLAAKLVRLRARAVAYLIWEKTEQRKICPPQAHRNFQEQPPLEEGDDSDNEEQPVMRDDSIETLAPVREFLLETSAFEKLKVNLREYVKRQHDRRTDQSPSEIKPMEK